MRRNTWLLVGFLFSCSSPSSTTSGGDAGADGTSDGSSTSSSGASSGASSSSSGSGSSSGDDGGSSGASSTSSSSSSGGGDDAGGSEGGSSSGSSSSSGASSSSGTGETSTGAVWTNRYNSQRTGANTQETVLTQSNVAGGKFGLLFSRKVDGTIQAQPLYVPGLTIGGAKHNVVIVATEHDSVFAFDADDPAAATPLWTASMGPSFPNPTTPTMWCADTIPEIGIAATPVIDTSNADPTKWTLYVEAKTL